MPLHRFTRVEFSRFKAFRNFSLELKQFNILVGPNNAGKSTVLAAFRILEAAMRQARRQQPHNVPSGAGRVPGYYVDIRAISVAEENIFHDYDESEPATVVFHLSNQNTLTLHFPERGTCILFAKVAGTTVASAVAFRSHFDCPIGFVPILGPVEHHERMRTEATAKRALFTYNAARNFRNIWFHYNQDFDTFRDILQRTWPGMDIEKPRVETSHGEARLVMFCLENRIPREIFWAGFGFQVWAQMLTHLIHASEKSLFLIDEPDIYLHSELQRLLLSQLRNLGPDILIATHSTEIITEAEADDIVLVSKDATRARRIREPSQLREVFRILGSSINPILTQVAKTRRVLFVEGKDFQIIGRFAQRLDRPAIGNREAFAVIPIEGFNPERARSLKMGMEESLGGPIIAAVVLDRDYRSEAECSSIAEKCGQFCEFVQILERKEIENFTLIPAAIDRAAAIRVADRVSRTGVAAKYENEAGRILAEFAASKKSYVASQMLTARRLFERSALSHVHETTLAESSLETLERIWSDEATRLQLIPGKEALSAVNSWLQEKYRVTISPTAIIDALIIEEVPADMLTLVNMLSEFATTRPATTRRDPRQETA